MATKIILTTEQHEKLLNHIVSEVVTESRNLHNEDGTINENVWEKVKYGLSKLGRYKANGKILGKGKIDKQAAAQIQAIIDKQGNELIKNLDASIKQTNPEFPNNEKGNDFLNTIMEISGVYDSVVSGVAQGTIPADAANGIINDLRDYVKKYLDVDLTAAYSVVDEAEGNTLELTEDEAMSLDEAWGLEEASKDPNQLSFDFDQNQAQNLPATRNNQVATRNNQVATTNPNNQVARTNPNNQVATTPNVRVSGKGTNTPRDKYANVTDIDYEEIPNSEPSKGALPQGKSASNPELNAKDVRAGLQAKRGAGGKDFASTRMDTLKSNKLPMTLLGVGASLGAFSWLVNTEWFKHLFDIVTKTPTVDFIKTTVANNTEIIGNIKPGQGLTQLMNSMNHAGITPNTTPEQFLEQVKILGGGDVNAGINALAAKGGIFVNSNAAKSVLTDIAQNPHGHGNTLGQIFKGKWAGTGRSIGDMLTCKDMGQVKGLIAGTLTKSIPTIVMKTAVKTGAGYAAAKGLGAILGPIGVAAVATGALVKIMRMKGQKQSRAKTLNDLYQSMQNIEGGTGVIQPETEMIPIQQASNPKELSNIINANPELAQGTQAKGELGQGQQPAGQQKQLGKGQSLGDYVPKQGQDFSKLQPKTPAQLQAPNQEPTQEPETNIDETYSGLINLFKGIIKSKKGSSIEVGGKAEYKGKAVEIVRAPINKSVKVKFPNGKTQDVPVSDIKPTPEASDNDTSKFVTNQNLYTHLKNTIGINALNNFEGFLANIIEVKKTIKTLKPTGNKNIDSILARLQKNPIMQTELYKIIDNSVMSGEYYQQIENLIKGLNTIYSKTSKDENNLIKNLVLTSNTLEEASGFKKQAKLINNETLTKNLTIFYKDLIQLFKAIIDSKRTQPTQVKTKKPVAKKPMEETVDENPILTEQINRIKKIMYKLD